MIIVNRKRVAVGSVIRRWLKNPSRRAEPIHVHVAQACNFHHCAEYIPPVPLQHLHPRMLRHRFKSLNDDYHLDIKAVVLSSSPPLQSPSFRIFPVSFSAAFFLPPLSKSVSRAIDDEQLSAVHTCGNIRSLCAGKVSSNRTTPVRNVMSQGWSMHVPSRLDTLKRFPTEGGKI